MFGFKKGNANNFAVFLAIICIIAALFISTTNGNSNLAKSGLDIPARPAGYVNDFAGVISQQNKDNLDSYLKELDAKTTAQVAVVTLPSLKGNSIEEVALDIGRKWGVGQKEKNNGIVILVATGDKKMRIEVGYGLEGAITDGKAGRIRDEYMIPYFRQGNYDQGIVNGTLAVASAIAKEYQVEMPAAFNSSVATLEDYSSSPAESSETSDFTDLIFIILVIVFIIWTRGGSFIGGFTDYGSGFGGSSGGGFGGFGGGSFGGGGASGGW